MTPRMLIVGGGIAGLALAALMDERWHVTVSEQAAGRAGRGFPVDVRGDALDVVRHLGLLGEIQARRTLADVVEVRAPDDTRIGILPSQAADGVEISRSDLVEILARAADGRADLRYDDAPLALVPRTSGVEVTFTGGRRETFDLVVGADGAHSWVRGQVFGPEALFATPQPVHVATAWVAGVDADGHAVVLRNAPGRLVASHPMNGHGGAAFIFHCGHSAPAEGVAHWVRDQYRDLPMAPGSALGAGGGG